jgi:hypothetical protein
MLNRKKISGLGISPTSAKCKVAGVGELIKMVTRQQDSLNRCLPVTTNYCFIYNLLDST